MHSGACWHYLGEELTSRGHRVVAPDFPIEDPYAGALHYAQTAVDALGDAGDDVVIVAHSFAGLTAPVLATTGPFPIWSIYVPSCRHRERCSTPIERRSCHPMRLFLTLPGLYLLSPEMATQTFCNGSPLDLVAWACMQLRPDELGP